MKCGNTVDFQRYLEQSKKKRHEPVLWKWKEILSSAASFGPGERGSAALVRPNDEEDVTIAPGLSGAIQIVEPGATTTPHQHSFWHLYVVQSGEGDVLVSGVQGAHRVAQSDVFYIPAWSEHILSNLNGAAPFVVIALQNLPAMAEVGCVMRRNGEGAMTTVFLDPS